MTDSGRTSGGRHAAEGGEASLPGTPGLSPSQTIGPFFSHALPSPAAPYVVPEDHPDAVAIEGVVYDGAGEPVPDAMIETWQADAHGQFTHADHATDFSGFARCPTDKSGHYRIVTVKPGPTPGPEGAEQAPHLDVSVFARGLLHRLVTRVYFPDEEAANKADPVLSGIADDAARETVIAQPYGSAGEAGSSGSHPGTTAAPAVGGSQTVGAVPPGGSLRFDIHLQGDHETLFFAL